MKSTWSKLLRPSDVKMEGGGSLLSRIFQLSEFQCSVKCNINLYRLYSISFLNGHLGMELECTMDEQDTEWCLPWQVLLSSQSHAASGRGCARCRIRVSEGANRWVFLKSRILWQRKWIGTWKMIINGWHSYDIMIAISKYAKILKENSEKWSLWRMTTSYTKSANSMVFWCLLGGGFLWRRCSSSCSPNSHGNGHRRWEPRGWSSGSECQVPSICQLWFAPKTLFFLYVFWWFEAMPAMPASGVLGVSWGRFRLDEVNKIIHFICYIDSTNISGYLWLLHGDLFNNPQLRLLRRSLKTPTSNPSTWRSRATLRHRRRVWKSQRSL